MVIRIVVPDFENLVKNYFENLTKINQASKSKSKKFRQIHDKFISAIIEQSVRKEAHGTSNQPKFRRIVENYLLGDARKRGETHQWMYDRISLEEILIKAGFKEIETFSYNKSKIKSWNEIGLDLGSNNKEYKPGSLYMEAVK